MMKVYICFLDYAYDGFSEPKVVYASEKEAKAWVDRKNELLGPMGEYVEMNVEGLK